MLHEFFGQGALEGAMDDTRDGSGSKR